jgi:hypothetical protein
MPIVESAIADATRTTGKTANGTMDADDDDDFDCDEDTGAQSIGGDAFGRGTLAAHGKDGGGHMAKTAAAESTVAGAANLTTSPCSMRVPV